MRKIKYPTALLLTLFTLFSCVEEFQPQQKRDQPTVKPTAKSSNCIYWYLISSETSNNITNTSQKFVYSSCGDYNTPSVTAAENTDDNSNLTSAGGPSFPTSPAVNDKYEYTSPAGDYVQYKFTIDRGWRVVERMIPDSVIRSYPDMYTFLNINNPYDGQVIFGLDDLHYTYDADHAQWRGL
ncbi:MAG TPA: hypothetical protein VFE57_06975 [Cyclobacteriaceae bacterium]|nr:hypothetical protein [Cyclobacteriaceae bacterium]